MRISELYQKEKRKAEELSLRDKRVHYLTEPLKSEISRLTKDNNNLHNSLITLKEDLENSNDQWKIQVRTLEDQKSDTEYMLNSKTNILNKVQEENNLLRTKCEEILIKLCYSSSLLDAGVNEQDFFQAITSNLNIEDDVIKDSDKKKIDRAKSFYNTLKEAYEKSNDCLRSDLEKKDKLLDETMANLNNVKSQLQEKDSQLENFEKRLILREKEVLRLQVKLEENPVDFLKLNENYEKKVSGDLVETLESKIEHLRIENAKLHTKLEAMEKDYMSKDHLKKELRGIEDKKSHLEKIIEDLKLEKDGREKYWENRVREASVKKDPPQKQKTMDETNDKRNFSGRRSSYNSDKVKKSVDFDTPDEKGRFSYNGNNQSTTQINMSTTQINQSTTQINQNNVSNEKTQFEAERRRIEQEINDLKKMYDEIIEGKNGEIDKLGMDIEKYLLMNDTIQVQLKQKDQEKQEILLQKKEDLKTRQEYLNSIPNFDQNQLKNKNANELKEMISDLYETVKHLEFDLNCQINENNVLTKDNAGFISILDEKNEQLKLCEEDIYKLRKALLDQEEMEISNKDVHRDKMKHQSSKINQLDETIKSMKTDKEKLKDALQKEHEKWHNEEQKKKEFWEKSESTRLKNITRIKELETTVDNDRICLEDKDAELEEKKQTIENYNNRNMNLEKIIKKYEVEKEKWSETIKDQEDLISKKNGQLKESNEEMQKFESLKDMYQGLVKINEKLVNDNRGIEQKFSHKTQDLEEANVDLVNINDELNKKSQELFQLKNDLTTACLTNEDHVSKIEDLDSKINDLNAELDKRNCKINEQNENLQESAFQEKALEDECTSYRESILEWELKFEKIDADRDYWKDFSEKQEGDLNSLSEEVGRLNKIIEVKEEQQRNLKFSQDEMELACIKYQNFEKLYNDNNTQLKEMHDQLRQSERSQNGYKESKDKELYGLKENLMRTESELKFYKEKYPKETFEELQRDTREMERHLDEQSQLNKDLKNNLEKENKDLKEKLETSNKKNKNLNQKFHDLDGDYNELKDKKEKADHELKIKAQKLKGMENEIFILEKELTNKIPVEEHDEKVAILQNEIKEYSEKCVLSDNEAEIYKDKFYELENEYRKLLNKLEDENNELQHSKENCILAMEEINKLKLKSTTMSEDLDVLKSRYEEEKDKSSNLKSSLQEAEDENYQYKKKIQNQENDTSQLNRKIGSLENEVVSQKDRCNELNNEVQRIAIYETEVRVYQEKIHSLESALNNFKDKCFILEEEKNRNAGTREGEMKVLQMKLSNTEKDYGNMKDRFANLETEVQNYKDKSYKLSAENNLNQQRIFSLETELRIYKEKRLEQENELKQLQKKLYGLESQLKSSDSELKNLKTKQDLENLAMIESLNERTMESQARMKEKSIEDELEHKKTIEDYGKQIQSMNVILDNTINELRSENHGLQDTIKHLERQYAAKCNEYDELEKLNLELREVAKEQGDLRKQYEKDLKILKDRQLIWNDEKHNLTLKLEEVKKERLALLETGEKLRNEIVIMSKEIKVKDMELYGPNSNMDQDEINKLRSLLAEKDDCTEKLKEDVRYKGLEMMRLSKEISRIMEERDELVKSKLQRSMPQSPQKDDHSRNSGNSERTIIFKLQDERDYLMERLNEYKEVNGNFEESGKIVEKLQETLDNEREMSQSLYQNQKELEKSKEESEDEIKHLRRQVQELLSQMDLSVQGTGRMNNFEKNSCASTQKLNSMANVISDYNDLNYNDMEYQYTSGDKQLLKVMEESNLYANKDENIQDKYQSIRGKTDLRSEYTQSSQKKLSVHSYKSSKHDSDYDNDNCNVDSEAYQHSFGKKQKLYDQYYE